MRISLVVLLLLACFCAIGCSGQADVKPAEQAAYGDRNPAHFTGVPPGFGPKAGPPAGAKPGAAAPTGATGKATGG